jgi:TfoX/Sxy family transcriptional regulator of competence genes
MAGKAGSKKMPRFTPASEATVKLFLQAVKSMPDVEGKKMFGYPCAFLNGQMLTGVFADRMMVRLSEVDRRELLSVPGARPFEPVPGRIMREYLEVPPQVMASPAELERWMARGLRYVRTLPPKAPKPKREAR